MEDSTSIFSKWYILTMMIYVPALLIEKYTTKQWNPQYLIDWMPVYLPLILYGIHRLQDYVKGYYENE